MTSLPCTLSGKVSVTERSIGIAEFQVGHLNLSGVDRIQYLAQNFLPYPLYRSGSEKILLPAKISRTSTKAFK